MLDLKKHIQTVLQMQVVASNSPLGWALVRRYTRVEREKHISADVQVLRCTSVLGGQRCTGVQVCK